MKTMAHTDCFEWSGGHSALDFVNTLDDRPLERPVEILATYRDLVLFTELAGLIEPAVARKLRARSGPECSRVVTRARALREHFFGILAVAHADEPAPQADLDAIAAAAQAAHAARMLVAEASGSLASYRWLRPVSLETPLHACALAVENLLVMDIGRGRIRQCGAPDCEVYFIDTSKGHRRRWCSMENCGNREKQRRWRAGGS
jgi:predicted RNA-binding Zn ribbon-like protein